MHAHKVFECYKIVNIVGVCDATIKTLYLMNIYANFIKEKQEPTFYKVVTDF